MLDTTTRELAEIPTHDPEAALRFCRALAHLVEGSGLPALPPIAAPHPVISIVAPIFDERENLPVLYDRLIGVMDATEPQFEIVLVDDGSRDGSLDILHGLAARDARVVGGRTGAQLRASGGDQCGAGLCARRRGDCDGCRSARSAGSAAAVHRRSGARGTTWCTPSANSAKKAC